MDAAADYALAFSVVHTVFQVQEVDADTRGERSDGRIGTGNAAATMLMQKGMTKKNPSAPDETSMGSRASPDDGGCMPRAAQSV